MARVIKLDLMARGRFCAAIGGQGFAATISGADPWIAPQPQTALPN